MPERVAYDQAMQAAKARLRVADPDLKQGEVDMMKVPTARGVIERPWGVEGGFAVVYRFRTQSGKIRALRCFRVPINPDTRQRYQLIGPYFAKHLPTITAEFKYHDPGIVIKETPPGKMAMEDIKYPIIEMEWIEGKTLLEHVDNLCKKHDKAALGKLLEQWISLMNTMRQAKMAHGDLAGANVMVRNDGRLVLVDYDGVYIPDFVGMLPVVAGQPGYQHRDVQKRLFNERMDDFSAMVIYTAILAAHVQPSLWNKYSRRDAQGNLDGNMMFSPDDLKEPQQSALIAALENLGDARLKMAIRELKQACMLPINQYPVPLHLFDPDSEKKQTLALLEKALHANNEEDILKYWTTELEQFGPAQQYAPRVKQIRQHKQFRVALKSKNIQQIVTAYDASLNNKISKEERDLLSLAQEFYQAYRQDEDKALLDAYEEIQNFQHRGDFTFTEQEQKRVELAQRRKTALSRMRLALHSKHVSTIGAAYDVVLENHPDLTAEERSIMQLAWKFTQAWQKEDDEALLVAYDNISHSTFQKSLAFSTEEEQRLTLARQRKVTLMRFRMALGTRRPAQIAQAYEEILDSSQGMTAEEREQYALAYDFAQAYKDDDDAEMATVWEEIQKSRYQKFFVFTPEEVQRLTLARQRRDALLAFRAILPTKGKNAQQLLAAYNPVLDNSKSITKEERERIANAQRFVSMYQAIIAALTARNNRGDDGQIIAAYDEELAQLFADFTPQQLERINRALKFSKLDQALNKGIYGLALKLAQEISMTYKVPITDERLSLARRKFVKPLDPRHLEARLQGDMLHATWNWPADEMIQHVVLSWNPFKWPDHPASPVNDSPFIPIYRGTYVQQGGVFIKVGQGQQLYVRVFSAIQDYLESSHSVQWYYSDGIEPTSRKALRHACTIQYRLTQRPGSPANELEIQTLDGCFLPELLVVRKVGSMPLDASDGEIITRVGGWSQMRVLLPFDVSWWPGSSVLRVFPAHEQDAEWLTLTGPQGLKLEVN